MKTLNALFATLAIAAAALPILADDIQRNKTFVEMTMESPDGKIEKSRVMAMMDKGFDKFDTRKEGKLDKRQARQFELFLREFTRESGA